MRRKKIYDRIRKKWVESTPEEVVRQHVITYMIDRLCYPSRLIAVEREIAALATYFQENEAQKKSEIPKRRIDIIVFAPKKLNPLLIIECKAMPLTSHFTEQVISYNSFIKAPFIAIANEQEILTGVYNGQVGNYQFEKGLPFFSNLK